MSKSSTKWVIAAGLSLVVLVLFLSNKNAQPAQPLPTPVPSASPGGDGGASMIMMPGSSAIYVADQKPGQVAVVSTVYLNEPGFVAIHSSTEGEPGPISGISDHIENSADMLEISLDDPLEDGEEYYAKLYKDVNNNQLWDGPVTDTEVLFNDEPIMMSFRVSETAEEPPAVAF